MADKDLQHVQHIRGSEAASDAYTGLEGEVTINRTSQSVRVHDGVTEGGHGTVYHARVAEIPNENDIPKDWAVGCRVIAGPGTVAGAGVVPLPDLGAEQTIGVFNGKKVYEKMYAFRTPSVKGSWAQVVDVSDLNIDKVFALYGSLYDTANDDIAFNFYNSSSGYYCPLMLKSKTNIMSLTGQDNYVNREAFCIIRYTKTTD